MAGLDVEIYIGTSANNRQQSPARSGLATPVEKPKVGVRIYINGRCVANAADGAGTGSEVSSEVSAPPPGGGSTTAGNAYDPCGIYQRTYPRSAPPTSAADQR